MKISLEGDGGEIGSRSGEFGGAWLLSRQLKETGIGKWSEADIVVALRNGKRPDGSIIGPPMPIPMYRQLSDQDATAIAAYLLSGRSAKNPVEKNRCLWQLPWAGRVGKVRTTHWLAGSSSMTLPPNSDMSSRRTSRQT
jgi:hypothetical protein